MTMCKPAALSALKIVLISFCLTIHTPGLAQEDRGQGLYENHCQQCHDSQVHKRAGSRPETIGELRAWVSSMSAHTDLGWGDEEINDLVRYLNRSIYHFPE